MSQSCCHGYISYHGFSHNRLKYAGDNFVRHSGDTNDFAKSQSMLIMKLLN